MPPASPFPSRMFRQTFPDAPIAIPGDPSYENAVDIWAGGRDRRPAGVYVCRQAADVQTALRIARDCGLAVSVRGGGHDWARRALCDGLVIDLTSMRNVQPHDHGRTIQIGGGALASDVFAATDPRGMAVVTGASGAVGMAGLTLGGGYGSLVGRFGLALDNLVSAEVVLADGSIAHTSDTQHADLFWALRGGGGNFGVVVSMEHRLHRLETVYGGPLFYPIQAAPAVLANYASIASDRPDALTVQFGLLSGPDGSPVLLVAPTWSGKPGDAEAQVAPLLAASDPLMSMIAHQPYGASNTLFDAHIVNGQRVLMDTRSLPALSPAVIEILLDAFARRPSSGCAIVTHEFRGEATRIATDATAFAMREPHLLIEIVAGWNAGSDDDEARHADWVARLSSALATHALPGCYANLLANGEPARAAASFGANAARIVELKRRFDPDNAFRSALPLPTIAGDQPSRHA